MRVDIRPNRRAQAGRLREWVVVPCIAAMAACSGASGPGIVYEPPPDGGVLGDAAPFADATNPVPEGSAGGGSEGNSSGASSDAASGGAETGAAGSSGTTDASSADASGPGATTGGSGATSGSGGASSSGAPGSGSTGGGQCMLSPQAIAYAGCAACWDCEQAECCVPVMACLNDPACAMTVACQEDCYNRYPADENAANRCSNLCPGQDTDLFMGYDNCMGETCVKQCECPP